jgi:hypothetical protein
MRHTLSFLTALGAALLVATAPAVLAQNLPVGVSGYWKITKMYPKKSVATPTCAANPAFFNKNAKGSRVLLSDRRMVWGAVSATNPAPRLSMMDPADFIAHHSQAGVTLQQLGLNRSSKIQTIKLGAPGTLPFDTIVILDPSTLYFERCGIFVEAVHDNGFVAPPLPNQR